MRGNRWAQFFTIYGVALCALFAYASYSGSAGLFDFFTRAHRGPGSHSAGALYHK